MQRILFLILALVLVLTIALGLFFHSRFIGKEVALNTALADAGVLPDQAAIQHTELDLEDGHFTYGVEFTAGGTEYDYVIAARDGRILEKDAEPAEGASPAVTESAAAVTAPAVSETEDIWVENAKAAALTKAGLAPEDVLFRKVSRDLDDGQWIYEIEFVYGGREYDYEIAARSGEVLSEDIDP